MTPNATLNDMRCAKMAWAPEAPQRGPARRPAYLRGVCMLVLQLLQVELVDLPKDQQLPVQEFHLLLDRLAVGELTKAHRQAG